MHSRLWVLATPVDDTLIDLTLVSQVREIRNPKRPVAGLRFIPVKLRHRLIRVLQAQGLIYFRTHTWENTACN